MLGTVVSDEVYDALREERTHNDEEIRAALWRLPGDLGFKRATSHPERRRSR